MNKPARQLEVERLMRKLASKAKSTLPKEIGFLVFAFDFGPKGFTAYAANALRDDAVNQIYEWIEKAGVGVPLAPTLLAAATILRITEGEGIARGALTPARAFAMGVHMALGYATNNDDLAATARQGAKLIEMMLVADPIADAEFAAEAKARS